MHLGNFASRDHRSLRSPINTRIIKIENTEYLMGRDECIVVSN